MERYVAGVTVLFRKDSSSIDHHAVQCRMYPTVNTYGVNITNEILEENPTNHTRILYTYYFNYYKTLEDSPLIFRNYRMTTIHMLHDRTQELSNSSKDPQKGMVRFAKKVGERTEECFYNGTYITRTYELDMDWY